MKSRPFTSLLITTAIASSCASREARPEVQAVEASRPVEATEVRDVAMTTARVLRSRAIGQFTPAREANLTGGECRSRQMPAPGVVSHSAIFPNDREPDTSITIVIDAEGKIVRYSENRGLPRPNRDLAAARAEHARLTRTHIQLDYVTGEALASNFEGGSSNGMVIGSVKEFEENEALGDLIANGELVRRLCATGR